MTEINIVFKGPAEKNWLNMLESTGLPPDMLLEAMVAITSEHIEAISLNRPVVIYNIDGSYHKKFVFQGKLVKPFQQQKTNDSFITTT